MRVLARSVAEPCCALASSWSWFVEQLSVDLPKLQPGVGGDGDGGDLALRGVAAVLVGVPVLFEALDYWRLSQETARKNILLVLNPSMARKKYLQVAFASLVAA